MPKKKNTSSQLKPCPICKKSGVPKKGYEDMYYVRCPNNCYITKYFHSEQEAIDAWNKGKASMTISEKCKEGLI